MTKKLLLLLIVMSFNFGFSQNNYLDFDGIDDNVTITNSGNTLAGATAISLSCKVFPKSTTTGFPNFNGIAGYRNESTFDFYLIQLSTTEIEARFRNSSGAAYTLSYTGLVPNQWNHLFLVFDGTMLKLYSGNTLVNSMAASGSVPTSNTSTFKIGIVQFQAYNWTHNGYIDEVSLWNKGLSAAEIGTIMTNNGEIANPSGETNLKLYYKFNQGVPYGNNTGLTTLIDEKATLNGTLNNFTLNGSTSNWGSQNLNTNSFSISNNYIYPNPTSNMLNFSGFSEISNIKIIDLSGRTVINITMDSTQEPKIDVSQLTSGMYIAVLNETQKLKFTKK